MVAMPKTPLGDEGNLETAQACHLEFYPSCGDCHEQPVEAGETANLWDIRTMATVHFTSHLQAHVGSEPVEVRGETVRAALDAAFAENERLRSYVLDDQSCLRRHMMIFVDGKMIVDRIGLTDPVEPNSEIYVMQALSGG
jgi:hypothetical protein